KARTSKESKDIQNSLITYFRRGKLQKFFMADSKQEACELDFLAAAGILESKSDEKKKKLPADIYDLLDKNKAAFIIATTEEMAQRPKRKGLDSAANILRILKATLKNTRKLTEDQEKYLKKVLIQLEEGGLPRQTAKKTLKALNRLGDGLINPFKVLAVLQTHIPQRLLKSHYAEQNPAVSGKREVILSLYLKSE
ncbi:MAG: helicase, partial [Thermodesulfobacteriota bacterium]|nr:helicase [Thermodesulfobacteriota bacterium]